MWSVVISCVHVQLLWMHSGSQSQCRSRVVCNMLFWQKAMSFYLGCLSPEPILLTHEIRVNSFEEAAEASRGLYFLFVFQVRQVRSCWAREGKNTRLSSGFALAGKKGVSSHAFWTRGFRQASSLEGSIEIPWQSPPNCDLW